MELGSDSIHILPYENALKPVDVITLPHPGYPTDLQAQMIALMTQAEGISIITERIYPNRFMHVPELQRMGAVISIEGASAIVKGPIRLSGAPVMASDLRASAALVLAGIVLLAQQPIVFDVIGAGQLPPCKRMVQKDERQHYPAKRHNQNERQQSRYPERLQDLVVGMQHRLAAPAEPIFFQRPAFQERAR